MRVEYRGVTAIRSFVFRLKGGGGVQSYGDGGLLYIETQQQRTAAHSGKLIAALSANLLHFSISHPSTLQSLLSVTE